MIEIPKERTGCIIEVKYAENGDFDKICNKALEQIQSGNYTELLKGDGMEKIYIHAVACYKKSCQVRTG